MIASKNNPSCLVQARWPVRAGVVRSGGCQSVPRAFGVSEARIRLSASATSTGLYGRGTVISKTESSTRSPTVFSPVDVDAVITGKVSLLVRITNYSVVERYTHQPLQLAIKTALQMNVRLGGRLPSPMYTNSYPTARTTLQSWGNFPNGPRSAPKAAQRNRFSVAKIPLNRPTIPPDGGENARCGSDRTRSVE